MKRTATTCRRCGGTGHEPDWRLLGDAIRGKRRGLGLALREVARRAACSPAYVTDVEYGRRAGLGGVKVQRIIEVVGMTPIEAARIAGVRNGRA